ncbi:MAG: VanW family protein [bacterium]
MKKNLKGKKILVIKKGLWAFYALIILSVLLLSFYHLIYAKTIIPGVRIKNQNLGGLGFSPALTAIKNQVSDNRDLKLSYNEQIFDITAQEIELTYNIAKTANSAFNIGRKGGFLENLKTKVSGISKPIYVVYDFSYNNDVLDKKVATIAKDIETAHHDAYFSLNGNVSLFIVPEEAGIVIDGELFKKQILEVLAKADFSEIPIETSIYKPTLTKIDLEKIHPEMETLINNLPMFVFENKTWQITKNDFLQMIVLTKKDEDVLISADKEKVKTLVISLAEQINRPPKASVFNLEGEKVVDFRLPTPGYVVKEHSAVEIFSLALLDSSMERQIDVPAEEFLPPAKDNSYGIKELIGEGVSVFVGSSQGRIFNIELAAKNLNGILITPNTIFSFNNSVGPIDSAHGFTTAYVISKGRTVLGEGGGVCQVSTTLFRAVLNSGLPITARTAHAYRVSYYEQDKPVGFDATIYQPTVDLKFKNDTQNYVLIQTEFIKNESKLYFRLYGTKDGREVKSLESKILSQSPPPAPLYQDDPSLAKGVIKQVDWSAWGAVVELKRVVEKDGKVLYEDTFISNYQPWKAVYLTGTAE